MGKTFVCSLCRNGIIGGGLYIDEQSITYSTHMSNVVRLITLKMKETGADVHAIGDGGFAGCTSPENIHQLSVSIKGRPYTYFRMASTNI